ncbi:MAG: hypothetical protein SOX70_07010 [Peptoniphilaceae bacterium]|nr:hypothetical protein [Peptoniphilaceae bacterium]MDY4196978.1 hypothetical protein [Peptoniphilaceae bacterium]
MKNIPAADTVHHLKTMFTVILHGCIQKVTFGRRTAKMYQEKIPTI